MPKKLNISFDSEKTDNRLCNIYRSDLIKEYESAKMIVKQTKDVETLQYFQGVAELCLKLLKVKGFE